jgi:hypothetical protein
MAVAGGRHGDGLGGWKCWWATGCVRGRVIVRLQHGLPSSGPSGWSGRLCGCWERTLVITVVDADAARSLLSAGLLACPEPDCEGRLRVRSRARARRVMVAGGRLVELRPDRGLCRSGKVM